MMMAGGCALFSVFFGLSDGVYRNVIDMFTRSETGHVQIHKGDYLDKPSPYKVIRGLDEIGPAIERVALVASWAPRVYSPALAFANEKTTALEVVGLDPVREPSTTAILKKLTEGRVFSGEASGEVVISGGLARILRAGIGDDLALIAQGADGSVANDMFRIVGIAGSGGADYERSYCYMHIDSLRGLLSMTHGGADGGAHEIVVVLDDLDRAREGAVLIAEAIGDPSLEVAPWQVVEAQFYRAMLADLKGNYISIVIFTVIIAVGVLNTVLMMILERTREYGVLRAIGTRPRMIFGLIVLETSFLAAMSIAVGAAAGLGLNWWIEAAGIELPEPISYGGMEFRRYTTLITPKSVLAPAAIVYVTALVVSIVPAIRAATVVPVKALRSE